MKIFRRLTSRRPRPRPFDCSPGRKFGSTVSSRLKQRDEIPYQPAEKRIRPVPAPPTPVVRCGVSSC